MKKPISDNQQSWYFYLKQTLLGFFDALIFLFLLLFFFMAWIYFFVTPPAKQLIDRKIAQTSIIYDRTGTHMLYEMHGEENRKILQHVDIPDDVRIATVATEDANFYHHVGIDPSAVLRALKVNLENKEIVQGGSTITQQLARSAFLTKDKTIQRKFLEAVFALKIERHYSKDEILDQYLNEVPYGANAYGIETASETFFGKPAKELTLDEAALLAALPKAPSYFSPYNVHRAQLVQRQKYILSRIGELKLAPQNEVDAALAVDTLSKIKPPTDQIVAPHFVFYVLDQLEQQYGKDFLQTGGLKIYTTLDFDKQQLAEQVVAKGAAANISKGANNAALVAVDPRSGDVLAMVGSKDFFDTTDDGQVNVATSLRQPGSAFKPFVYATAFEKGYQPETMILDAPTDFGPDGSGTDYIPRNYDGKFHGLLPMRDTLAQSLNIPAIKTLYLAGIDNTIRLAQSMGITTLDNGRQYGLSLAIGGGDVKLVDMASAFSVFANDGVRNPVRSILKITDSSGKVLQQSRLDPTKVLDPQIARKIDSILSDNAARAPIFGANSPLVLSDGHVVAAKTGTTNDFRDGWTVGFTPSITVGVWAGNNNNSPMKAGEDGVFVAAPMWHDFMQQVLAGQPEESFIAYDVGSGSQIADTADSSGQQFEVKTTYYNNKTGKEISEKKAGKIDPEKVDKKIEYIPVTPGSSGDNIAPAMSIALPDPNDPMFKRWAQADISGNQNSSGSD
jgi:1A family penicillin-binding protein